MIVFLTNCTVLAGVIRKVENGSIFRALRACSGARNHKRLINGAKSRIIFFGDFESFGVVLLLRVFSQYPIIRLKVGDVCQLFHIYHLFVLIQLAQFLMSDDSAVPRADKDKDKSQD